LRQAIKAALAEYGQVETVLVNRRKRPWEVIHSAAGCGPEAGCNL
jgi:hypothetical protein